MDKYYFIFSSGWGTDMWEITAEQAANADQLYRDKLEEHKLDYYETDAHLVVFGADGSYHAEQVFIPELE